MGPVLTPVPPPALDALFDAHGGVRHWRSLHRLDVEMSAGGFLFAAKRIAPQQHIRMSVNTRSPAVVIHDYPQAAQQAVLLGADRVEIRTADGDLLAGRDEPAHAFSPMPLSPWDALNFAYFSGYAMWNYLTLPFLLLHHDVRVQVTDGPGGTTRVDVRFPPTVPTHSPVQRLFFDRSGRLYRHDYTARVVGGWARAAHLCSDYREFGGLWLPTTRRVYPRGPFGRPLPGPTLVSIDIHDVQVR